MKHSFWLLAVVVSASLIIGAAPESSGAPDRPAVPRVRRSLQVLYDFNSSSGSMVRDRSGVGRPLDLRITNPKGVRRSSGSLQLVGRTLIRSDTGASKVIAAVRASGEITIEAWLQSAKTDQTGPARIVTLSRNANSRNFTLGQDADKFEVRFRTTRTTNNGNPSLSTPPKTVTTKRTHVVYTRDRSGRTVIYLDGKLSADRTMVGSVSSWEDSMQLALGNEQDGKRLWLGTYHLVAIYNRDLTAREVERNFNAGLGATTPRRVPGIQLSAEAQLFETKIAPLLSGHCLECHDSASKEGLLDLSRKTTAFAGGESGKLITPGKSQESLLWEAIESDEMPKDRPPLSADEKKILRGWLDSGATWSLDRIDPAVYAHEGQAAKHFVQRLTVAEYIETVRSAVDVDIEKEARRILPPDVRADGFSNTAYNLGVDLEHIEAYARLAETIVSRMDVARFTAPYAEQKKLTDDNIYEVVSKMGHWLLRGPLEGSEIDALLGISTDVIQRGGDTNEAMGFILEAMLQSPRFIYRIEDQQGDGQMRPVGEYELASRMSYILWGSPPDKELMRAGDAGELIELRNVEAQVARMLSERRAVRRSLQFASEWLNLSRLANLQPNRKNFPNYDKRLAADMRAETLAFFEEVVWKQKRPLPDLLNAQVTFATPRLAKHYGLQPQGDGLRKYDVSSIPFRGGLLTQGSVLTIGGDNGSMVTRGLFVMHDLLRGVIKDPPPGVNTTPIPTREGLTQRGIAEGRIKNVSCGGCHSRFEPLAFGLERFDGIGAYATIDKYGNKLREDGQILFPGEGKPDKFKTSAELMDLLAESDRVALSITWKVTQFALGRPLVAADARTVDRIHNTAKKAGGTYANLMTAIIMSDLVQFTRTEAVP